MKVCVFILLLFIAKIANAHTIRCLFDHHNEDLTEAASKNIPQVPQIEPGRYINGRLLVSPSTNMYGSIRIFIDTVPFTQGTIAAGTNGASKSTTSNLNFILQTLYVAKEFYQKRLKAGRLSSVTIPNYCVDFAPTSAGSIIANTQLLIFARYVTDGSAAFGYGATGKSCDYVTGSYPDYTLQVGRPTVGRMIFNTYNLVDQVSSLTNMLFQSVTTTTIHEMTHILGFDSTMYSKFLDPSTGYKYSYTVQELDSPLVNSNRPKTSILTTPYVKAWARTHFGCNTLTGMLLENQDGTGAGSASHWQRTAIYDEMMTATAFGATKGVFGLTFALLKDTGWYLADDTFLETTNYGYQRGCSFVLDACYNSTSFPEFCNAASQSSISSCQTTFYGKANCRSQDSLMSDKCGILGPYLNCVDPATIDQGYQSYTYEVYSTDSYCVKSTLGTVTIPSTLQSRCYPFVCGDNKIDFTVGTNKISCLSTEEGVRKTIASLTGTLTCPNFNQFCTISRKTCKNWCSKNGYCTEGVCNCLTTNFGTDCSITSCDFGQYYDPTSKTCGLSCPSGTYQNSFSQTCELCQSPCDQCATTPTNCIGCHSTIDDPLYFYEGNCYTACPSQTYQDGYQCVACSVANNCKTCTGSASTCTSCLGGLNLRYSACVSTCTAPLQVTDLVHKQCVAACPSYLLTTSATCVYCADGSYFQSGACQSVCVSSGSNNYYPDDSYHACMACSTSCNTCDGPYPENCTSCKSTSGNPYLLMKMCWAICPKGFFANPSGSCDVCPSSLKCQSCNYSTTTQAPYCTSCIYGNFYAATTSKCESSCNTNQYKNTWNNSCSSCDSACTTCNGPSNYSCLSCPGLNVLLVNSTGGYCLVACPSIAYVQVGSTCQPCDSTCKTCNGISASQCATCNQGYFLSSDYYCRYICPSGTFPNPSTLKCDACDSQCTFCFDGTSNGCTACVTNTYLYNFTCVGSCPSTQPPNQWGVCWESFTSITLITLLITFIILQ